MSFRISSGSTDCGVVIGNTYNKYDSRNPIVKWMMNGFKLAMSELVEMVPHNSIHEIGCGEGYWVLHWNKHNIAARGSDFSGNIIGIARENATRCGMSPFLFEQCSIYDLDSERDSADLVVCCEVLEHLEHPDVALQVLQQVVKQHLIISVPKEPLWCLLNLARVKYISHLGNTPGHIQHWSKNGFVKLVSKYFYIIEVRSPLPWTMLLCRPYG